MAASIREWLLELGLSDYVGHFEAQRIDLDAVPRLTDGHLREMGLPIGPRLRLLAAIGKGIAAEEAAEAVERRNMTVMFADLVGSTALSTRMDPEDLRELIRAFHFTVDSQVARYDTSVAQYKGDGALVYFGYPRAHEDDAERAVSAALAVVRAVATLQTPDGEPLAAHVGIATGPMVVGDTFGHATARERSAIGETPNLAARLVDLAGSGEVVVSAQTQQRARHQFSFEELDAPPLKGLSVPVQAFRVVAELAAETRFAARHGASAGRMVGRDRELATLLERWELAAAGQGQVVLVSGEAGIGKSRLGRALQQALDDCPHARISNQCSPQHRGTALYPMTRQIARAADFKAGDEEARLFDKLSKLLHGAAPMDLALTARLMGLEPGPNALPADITPSEIRQLTFDALVRHVERTASDKPVLWLLEDAHWIDPSSLELLNLSIQRIATLPVLAIVTFRPDFEGGFAEASHVSSLPLLRLSSAEVSSLVSDLCAGKPLPDEALAQIERQTDGVPLFIEELTKSLLDSGEFVERDGGWMLSERRRLAVPESLHDSLMSRLDRHRSQKEIAQIASCIGREFSHALLFRIAGLPVEVLDAALSQLQDAELVFKMRSGPDAQYAFKHALVCDAAYESLLKRRREELHARVLAELGRLADTPPELLATHAAAAGFTSQAIQLWAKAAALAMSRNAFGEAASHVGQALRLNEALPSSGESLVERLDLLLALGQATIPLRGYSHSDSVAVFSRAHDLAQELNDSQRAFWVSYARWVVYYVRGEHATAQSIASDMLQRARLDNHSGRELTALRALGISEMIGGAPHAADSTFARADQLAAQVWQQPERRLAVAQRFAADPQIATQFHVALTHWALGRVDRARELSAQAIHAARQMGHVHTLGHALTHGAIVAVIDRDPDLACRLCTEADAVAEKHGMELWRGYGKILHGYALALNGDLDQAAGLLQAGLERLSRTQTGTMVAMHHAVCAWTLTRLGKSEDAAVHERAACAELNDGTERYFWPETLVWLGRKSEQDRAGDGPGQAERLYWRALEEARRQQALGWELRAATALGGLWAARGERGRAADLLSPLLDRMEQGRASALWRDADALVRTTP